MNNEVIELAIISNGFWLVLILVAVLFFRIELKAILGSLGTFKVMGASFQLRDKRATLESYAILVNVLVEVLSERETAEKFYPVVSPHSARQLAAFARRYIDEVPVADRNVELIKNVALVVGRKGNWVFSLLCGRPRGDCGVPRRSDRLPTPESRASRLPSLRSAASPALTLGSGRGRAML